MIKLSLFQTFIADYLNILEIILLYRLAVKKISVRVILVDVLASLIIVCIPFTIDSLYLIIIVLYLSIGNKKKINNIIAISIGIVMSYIFDIVDHYTDLLLLKNDYNKMLGWFIPINELLITVVIGLIGFFLLKDKIEWLLSNLRNPIYIWKLSILLLIFYELLTIVAEFDDVTNEYFTLLFIMYFIIIAFGITTLANFVKNYQQAQQQQALIKSYQRQIEYSQRINKQFDNFRRERHDIKNLLLGVQGYIKDGENDKAEKMLSTFLDTNISDKHYLDVDNALSKLQISGLRNLIKEKAYQIVEQRILLAIEINNEISSLPGSEVKTARIIGILLDNAIEATKNQKKPYVQIALLQHDENLYELIVANSLGTPVDINKAMKFEHSTKQGHQGIGLSNVMKLVDHDQHYSFSAEVKDKVIIMTCFIQGKSE